MTIVTVLSPLLVGIAFNRAIGILMPATVGCLFGLVEYTAIACLFEHKTEFDIQRLRESYNTIVASPGRW